MTPASTPTSATAPTLASTPAAAPQIDITPYLGRLRGLLASRYRNHPEFEDLCQVGAIGLMKAAKRFDPARAGFWTYGNHRALGEVQSYLRERGTHARAAKRRAFEIALGESRFEPVDPAENIEERLERAGERAGKLDSKLQRTRRLIPYPGTVRVAILLALGLSQKEVAERAGIALKTVASHIGSIYRLLGIENRAQLTSYAILAGLIEAGDGLPERAITSALVLRQIGDLN